MLPKLIANFFAADVSWIRSKRYAPTGELVVELPEEVTLTKTAIKALHAAHPLPFLAEQTFPGGVLFSIRLPVIVQDTKVSVPAIFHPISCKNRTATIQKHAPSVRATPLKKKSLLALNKKTVL